MKIRPFVRLAALVVGLHASCIAQVALGAGSTVTFVETKWGDTRVYTATLPDETRKYEFTASHTLDSEYVDPRDWRLSLHGVWIDPHGETGSGVEKIAAREAANQDPFVSSDIIGDNGLLHQCIRKLREDVPDARVHALSLDILSFYESWPELRKRLLPAVKKTNADVTIMGPPGGSDIAYKYVNQAKQPLAIAARVAQWSGSKFDRIVWDHDHGLRMRLDYIRKPDTVLLEDRHLGLDIRSLSFDFLFKPEGSGNPTRAKR